MTPGKFSRMRAVLAALAVTAWQTRSQLGLPCSDGHTLLRLEKKGLVKKRPSVGRGAPYEYALVGAADE